MPPKNSSHRQKVVFALIRKTIWFWYCLQKKYWQTKYSVSFPRLRPAEGIIEPNFIMDDKDLTQLICAYRLWNEDLEISEILLKDVFNLYPTNWFNESARGNQSAES